MSPSKEFALHPRYPFSVCGDLFSFFIVSGTLSAAVPFGDILSYHLTFSPGSLLNTTMLSRIFVYSYQLYEQPVDELAGWFLEIADMCGCDIMLCKESHDSNPGVPNSFYYLCGPLR